MTDSFSRIPGRQLTARVELCLIADGADFVSRPVDVLALDFAGIVGDHHAGLTRRSGAREPWYPRGTEIRNNRQISIVCAEELGLAAAAMEIAEIKPEWIGANLVLGGIPDLSLLPAGTLLLSANGAAILVEAANTPCRIAGTSIGHHFPKQPGCDLLFPKHARNKRGVVASVERPGMIHLGAALTVRVPSQRRYAATAGG